MPKKSKGKFYRMVVRLISSMIQNVGQLRHNIPTNEYCKNENVKMDEWAIHSEI